MTTSNNTPRPNVMDFTFSTLAADYRLFARRMGFRTNARWQMACAPEGHAAVRVFDPVGGQEVVLARDSRGRAYLAVDENLPE